MPSKGYAREFPSDSARHFPLHFPSRATTVTRRFSAEARTTAQSRGAGPLSSSNGDKKRSRFFRAHLLPLYSGRRKAVSRRSRSLLRVQVKQEWFRDRGYVNRDILGKKIIRINIKELIIWNWRKKHGRLYLFAGHPVDSVACEGNGNTRRIRIQSNVSMFP